MVVLITGISASGKSTVAEALARRLTRGVHVRGDVFRRMVVSGREDMSPEPSPEAWRQLRLRYQLSAMTADAYCAAGFAVVLQDVVVGAVLSDYVAQIRSRPLVVVVLIPTPEVVAVREEGRTKTAYSDGAITIAAFDHALREETPHVGMWLDSSALTVEQTVDTILERGWQEGRIED
jgi:cytidylate kinase